MAEKEILWHTLSVAETLKQLTTKKSGLTGTEAHQRLNQYGYNKLPEEKPLGSFFIFVNQFKSPLVYVLLGAALISAVLNDITDTSIILGAVIINVLLGYYQENKASRAVDQLRKLVDIKAKVLRDGNEITISAKELVPGDIIFLSPGDKISADARVLTADNLQANESSLTGESIPVEKNNGTLKTGTILAERHNVVFAGTAITRGRGMAIVCATGLKTEIGNITQLVQQTIDGKTPLQLQIKHLGQILTTMVLALSAIIVVIGTVQGRPILIFGDAARESLILLAASVAVSAIPEGLLITMTAILSIGMQAILKRNALIRRLVAAETLGSVSVICSDKTGTLTTGVMEVERLITTDDDITVKRLTEFRPVGALQDHELITKIALLCNNAVIENPAAKLEDWKVLGDPTERALLLAALTTGLNKKKLETIQPRLAELPFDSETKYMATLHRLDEKNNVIYLKGAPEKLLSFSTMLRVKGKKQSLTAAKRRALEKQHQALTSQGLRLLAFAYKQVRADEPIIDLQAVLQDMTFIGFAALKDPLRPEAKETIALTMAAGIRPVIITGDHRLTAKAIVAELGLPARDENIIDGDQLDSISDEELTKRIKQIDIYARVEPRHKLRIIDAWQKTGAVVAMTGDGINDAPALKAADIGIALGSGTDVAKETADMILLDNNFKTIVAAVERGRVIFENIKKSALYLLSDSFSEIVIIIGTLLFKLPLPILPAHILWINIVNDGLPALAMTNEPGEEGVMRDKPRPRHAGIIDNEIKSLIMVISVATAILPLLLFAFFQYLELYPINHLRTLIFTILAVDSLLYIFSCRSLRHSVIARGVSGNRFLLLGVLVSLAAQIAAVYAPPLQNLLNTAPLHLHDWAIVAAVGIVNIILIELAKYYFIIRKKNVATAE